MKVIPFLTEAEIEKLQQQEAESDDSIKKSKEQIEAIYTSGQKYTCICISRFRKNFCYDGADS